jgi:putative exosortase-associated protein (TIGR04073 family)
MGRLPCRQLGLALALALGATAGLPAPARAQTPAHKFGRGAANLSCGIMELPAQMISEGRRRGPLWALSLGFARGVGGFVTRELVGVYELVTFPAPVPRGYRAILEPESPWDLFD